MSVELKTASGKLFTVATDNQSTATITPRVGSRLLIWVTVIMPGDASVQAPTPTFSGLDVDFGVLSSIIKGGSRRLTLAMATINSPTSGAIRMDFSPALPPKAEIAWVACDAYGLPLAVFENPNGVFEITHSILTPNMPENSFAIAGFAIGCGDRIDSSPPSLFPGTGCANVGQGRMPSPAASTFVETSFAPSDQMACSWTHSAHALGSAVVFEP